MTIHPRASAILAIGHRLSSILCTNDNMAFDAMKALQEAGCRVPEEISVLGFDNILVSAYATPPSPQWP